MARYRLTRRARSQLQDIWREVAVQNEVAADGLLNSLLEKFERAALYPEIGAARPDIAVDARMLVERRYIVIYKPAVYGVRIVAVVHGMRDPTSWMA